MSFRMAGSGEKQMAGQWQSVLRWVDFKLARPLMELAELAEGARGKSFAVTSGT